MKETSRKCFPGLTIQLIQVYTVPSSDDFEDLNVLQNVQLLG